MDKSIARMVMKMNGIPCAPLTNQVPCVVKCTHGGSSIGVYICDKDEDLDKALRESIKFSDEIIIEKKIVGREFTVPVLGEKALPPIEIIPPQEGNFDYVAKYQSGQKGAQEICPANLDKHLSDKLKVLALKLHNAIKLSVYSRSDFIIDREGDIYCLEINSLPGLTPASLLPKAAKCIGLEYPDLCEKIVELSMKRKIPR